MQHARLLAIDLGAESGRGVIGTFDGEALTLDEIHRFPNRPFHLFGELHWNVYELYYEMTHAIGLALNSKDGSAASPPLLSIGIDTWGVDFGLLAEDDSLLGAPFHYRSRLSQGVMESVLQTDAADLIFNETGIQFLPFNTIFQLMALKKQHPKLLQSARSLLMMGELFTFWLTGEKTGELTNASTSQLVSAHDGHWSDALFSEFDLPSSIMPDIVQPGTVVGHLLSGAHPQFSAFQGDGTSPSVVVPAVHDTGSAVVAVPAEGDDWCYLSSGTWSLLGVEIDSPIITPLSQKYNFTHERGVQNTFRFLKNVMGLWILQESRRQWAQEGSGYDYARLTELALEAPAFQTLIDPDDSRFLTPGDMTDKIVAFAKETGQKAPETVGQFVRTIIESLALKYRIVIEQIQEVTGKTVRVIHVVGGGAQNDLLNQLTADVTGRRVVVGPVEATATGNLLVQAMSQRLIDSLSQARHVSRRSTDLKYFQPRATQADATGDAIERFERILAERHHG